MRPTRPLPRSSHVFALTCGILGSCSAPQLDVNSMVREWQNYMQSDYILRPYDQIAVSVHPEGVAQTLTVPPTGSLNLALRK